MPALAVKYCKPAPVTLKRWIDAHPERVSEFTYGFGYATNDNVGFAYDIVLRAGWRRGDDYVHTLIEETVQAMLTRLRGVVPCDCDECRRMIAEEGS
jgi:hypothetical protein